MMRLYIYTTIYRDNSTLITHVTRKTRRQKDGASRNTFADNRRAKTFPVAHANICCGTITSISGTYSRDEPANSLLSGECESARNPPRASQGDDETHTLRRGD